jgi:NarL family two-component system response regulator LiaR
MAENQTIRVLIADDHELLRCGIHYSLLTVDDIEVVAEASNGGDALRLCAEVQPDVVLMDMRMPGDVDSVAAIWAMRNRYPQVQVLALSGSYDRGLVHGAMQAGAVGYMVKSVSGEELVSAIRTTHVGQFTLTSEALEMLVQPVKPISQLGNDLTKREKEVLPLLVEGLSNAEIGQQLYISVSSVKFHINKILSKLGAANRTKAAALALEHNLIPKH